MPVNFTLKTLLAIRGKNQKWLAQETGIRPPTISAICNNSAKQIPVYVIDRICKALDCEPGDFITYQEMDKKE